MHEHRRKVAQTALGRVRLDGPDGCDEYDDPRAVYLMALGRDGGLQGCLRARPTDDRSFLRDYFAEYLDPAEGGFQGPDVWGTGRWVMPTVEQGLTKDSGVWRTADIILAAMEQAARAGATRMVGVGTVANFHRMRAANLNCRLVGPERVVEGVTGVAVETAITPEDIDAFRRSMGRVGWAGYEIDMEDMAAYGSFAAVERAFRRAKLTPLLDPEAPDLAIAQAERAFRQFR